MRIFFLMLVVLITIWSCTKEDQTVMLENQDPDLKVPACSPSVTNYYDRDTLYDIPFLPASCFEEIIMVTLYDVTTDGKLVIAGSCRFNDNGRQDVHITGIGLMTGHLFDSHSSSYYHLIGSSTAQGAQVTRLSQDIVFTDLQTGETFTTGFIIHQTINANGMVTSDSLEFIPCN